MVDSSMSHIRVCLECARIPIGDIINMALPGWRNVNVARDKNNGEVLGDIVVHPREPALLKKGYEATWINPEITEPEQLFPLLQPYPAEEMEGWRVADAAKNYRNDYP